MKKTRAELRAAVKFAEQNALRFMLVNLFDWLNSLEPQSVKDIVSLYEHSQAIDAKITNIRKIGGENRGAKDQVAKGLCCESLTFVFICRFESYTHCTKIMKACSKKPLNVPV